MSPFMKGAIGFLGCAAIVGTAYAVGKKVGREETLKEVEREERKIAESAPKVITVVDDTPVQPKEIIQPVETQPEKVEDIPEQKETAAERVRNKKRGLRSKIFGGVNVVKDLLGDPDSKKLTVTVEDGDVVARLSQKSP